MSHNRGDKTVRDHAEEGRIDGKYDNGHNPPFDSIPELLRDDDQIAKRGAYNDAYREERDKKDSGWF